MKEAGLSTAALLIASVVAVSLPSESVAAFRSNAIVQVRDIPTAPFVTIVAWSADEGDYGLRTRIARDGQNLGGAPQPVSIPPRGGRRGEHLLYLDSKFAENQGGFAHASVDGRVLRQLASERDMDACRFGECSPQTVVGVGVSDEVLRKYKARFIVQFRPGDQRPWEVTLRQDLIEAYLAAVDSVSASLKKPVN